MNLDAKKLTILMGIVFVLGIIWYSGLKFILYKSDSVHYHANFAVFINGQREAFKSNVYYEEAQSCSSSKDNPKNRVHLHENINHVVHVHDQGATWGHFFANLGYTLGDSLIATRDEVYIDGVDGKKLTFILNGQVVGLLANRTIGNTDRLLINYGVESEPDLLLRYSTVEHDATEVNRRYDPASCGGSDNTYWRRLKRAVW